MDDITENGNERQQLLERRVLELEAEVKSFGQKRAYFMDIYKRKEEEATKLSDELANIKHVKSRLESELKGIRDQVADMKTEHMITCINKEEELEKLKFMHRDELSSLNMSLQDLLNENSAKAELEDKIQKLATANRNLNEELALVKTALQGRMQREQDNLRTSMNSGKSSRPDARAPVAASAGTRSECNSSRCSEEKKALHLQLDAAHQTLQRYADQQTLSEDDGSDEFDQVNETSTGRKSKDLFEVVDHEEKLKEIEKELAGEKESRRDLEMYVEVLAKQKDVFQNEMDVIRKELRESLDLLEKERREHVNLKLTWQMANDQFLEAQRLLMIDMKRLESVLTEEQQRRVAELQRVDAEREAQQQKIDDLERLKQEQMSRIEAEGDSLLELPHGMRSSSSHTSLNSVEVYREFESAEPIQMTFTADTPSPSGSVVLASSDTAATDTVDCTTLIPPNINLTGSMLTEDMTIALAAPQAEDVENKRVLDQLRQATPDRGITTGAPGSRVVSERQWHKLQEELQQARANIGRTCEACKNYELELQKEQETVRSLESQLTQSRQNVKAKQKVVDDLEENMKSLGQQCKYQVSVLTEQLENADEQVYVLRARLEEMIEDVSTRMLSLVKQREDVQKQLLELEQENQQLLDMHSSTSSQMLAEQFDQPSDLPTAVKLLAEFRADIVTCKAAKEHIEKKMGQELQMLKDQSVAEQYQWTGREEALNQEIAALQEKNVRLESIESEMNRESKLRKELEERLEQAGRVNAASRVTENQLKAMIQTLQSDVARSNADNKDLVDKLRTLQGELCNSELVQKDFVKLSQQLQVQLEKIRQAETEVRWEHEDDVMQCNSCTVKLTSARDKHHCMHCGKIHCQDCSSKVVKAGPRRRPTRVCDVCHTILESDATPYFSTDAQSS